MFGKDYGRLNSHRNCLNYRKVRINDTRTDFVSSPGAKFQDIHITSFRLSHQVTNVSWYYLIETPIQTII